MRIRSNQSLFLLIAFIILSLSTYACGGGGGSNNNSTIITTTKIGTDGGMAQTQDKEATIDIPSGALSNDTAITITTTSYTPPPETGKVIGNSYSFGPDGQTFNEPVKITLKYDPKKITGTDDLGIVTELNGIPQVLRNIVVDTVNNQISGETLHFSDFTPMHRNIIRATTAIWSATVTKNAITIQSPQDSQNSVTGSRVVDANNPIVGSWGRDGVTGKGIASITFYQNNTYICFESSGVEYGTYNYDTAKKVLTATPTVDENGDLCLSTPSGQDGGVGRTVTWSATVTENTITIRSPKDSQDGGTGSRVVDANNPIVGSWGDGVTGSNPGGVLSLTFYPNGTYSHWQNGDQNCPTCVGVENGTYNYDSINHLLTATPTVDENGDVGLSNPAGTDSGLLPTPYWNQGSGSYEICSLSPVPPGYVVTGWGFNIALCEIFIEGNSSITIKKPGNREEICPGSPIPHGYVITDHVFSMSCLDTVFGYLDAIVIERR